MPAWPETLAVGAVIGLLYGVFGVGGSSFGTPVLGLLGVPGVVAVAAPLPAVIPAALAGMAGYVRRRQVEWPVARWAIYGGLPGTVVGGLLSEKAGGKALLVASGVVLGIVGLRILVPLPEKHIAGRARRRPAVVIPPAVAIGLFTGLLANGGGFLLVPLFVLGLTMPESAGTSLVVISAISLPTLLTHLALGHVDWSVAVPFGTGAVPGSVLGSSLAPRLPAEGLKRGFAVLLLGFATYFVIHEIRAP